MEKVEVRVCAGTTCYVMGGSELTDLARQIPGPWKDQVLVRGEVCLDLCRNTKNLRPPFVLVGEQVVDQASVEKVLGVLRGILS